MNCQNNNYRVIVNLDAIVHSVKVMGVIKTNAYGHGAVPTLKMVGFCPGL